MNSASSGLVLLFWPIHCATTGAMTNAPKKPHCDDGHDRNFCGGKTEYPIPIFGSSWSDRSNEDLKLF